MDRDQVLQEFCTTCKQRGLNGFDPRTLRHRFEARGLHLQQVHDALQSPDKLTVIWGRITTDPISETTTVT